MILCALGNTSRMDTNARNKPSNTGQTRAGGRNASRSKQPDIVRAREPSCTLRLAGGSVHIVDLNAAFADQFGIAVDSVRGLSIRDVLKADAALAMTRGVRQAMARRRPIKLAVPLNSAGRGARLLNVTIKRTQSDQLLATIPEIVVFGRRQSDKDMLDTLGAVDGGTIYVLDMETTSILYATERVFQLIGHPRDAIEGLVVDPLSPRSDFFRDIFHPDDTVAVSAHFADLRAAHDDTVVALLCRIRHSTEGWRWVEARSRVLSRARSGKVERVVGFAQDVTEHRRLSDDLRATSFALLQAEEIERRRIAREIHDSTAQHFVALDLGLSRLENMVGPDAPDIRDWIDEMRGVTRAAHQELRVATFALHPPELESGGLASTLRDLVRGFGRRTGLATEFEVSGDPRPTTRASDHALLRVSQEALLNIYKHASARTAKLRLSYESSAVLIEIEDDGVGSDLASPGVGLQSMKTRLAALGGVLSIVSGRNGVLVRAQIHQHD